MDLRLRLGLGVGVRVGGWGMKVLTKAAVGMCACVCVCSQLCVAQHPAAFDQPGGALPLTLRQYLGVVHVQQ